MLILTRKVGQKIIINDDIVVLVVGLNGNRVNIGIEAPKEVKVSSGKEKNK